MKDDDGFDKSSSSIDGKKGLDWGCLEIELIRFGNGLDVRDEDKGGVKRRFKFLIWEIR